jgi:hypothetical protein
VVDAVDPLVPLHGDFEQLILADDRASSFGTAMRAKYRPCRSRKSRILPLMNWHSDEKNGINTSKDKNL